MRRESEEPVMSVYLSLMVFILFCAFHLISPQTMWVWNWLVGDDTLTRKLRNYSAKHVKISEADMTRTKKAGDRLR